jgi:hypothetical protein
MGCNKVACDGAQSFTRIHHDVGPAKLGPQTHHVVKARLLHHRCPTPFPLLTIVRLWLSVNHPLESINSYVHSKWHREHQHVDFSAANIFQARLPKQTDNNEWQEAAIILQTLPVKTIQPCPNFS